MPNKRIDTSAEREKLGEWLSGTGGLAIGAGSLLFALGAIILAVVDLLH
jgi:hypothetical protein